MISSVIALVLGLAMGTALIWHLGGFASRMRRGLEGMPVGGAIYRRMPSWTLRVFGAWCLVFAVGQFIYFLYVAR